MVKYISMLMVLTPVLVLSCTPPLAGIRVWNIATKNIFITQSIESVLDNVSGIDAIDFSDLDQLLDKVTVIESKSSHLLQEITILQNDLIQDLSKTQQIQSNVGLLESNLALLDISGVFTALDALQTTIVSAMDMLNNELALIVNKVEDVTTSEIDYAQTIASQLDQLDTDVQIINSLLDAISANFSLTTFFSLTDVLQQDLVPIASNVQLLNNQITTGFTGTFTVLDQNLLLANSVESLTAEIAVMQSSDLTGTYSLLDELELSMQTIDSLTDLLIGTFATIESNIEILGSALDESVSKYMFVESRTSLLAQKLQELIMNPSFSVIDHATSLLDADISLLAAIYAADLPALTNSIESKLENIISQQDVQISDLDVIATAFSLIQALPYQTTTISKLSFANSQLDDVIADALATESYLNAATHIDPLDNAQSLLQQINYIDSLVPQISSKMIIVDNNLATTNSMLDVITALAQSDLNKSISIQSILDTLSFIPQPSSSISSTLGVISSQEDVVISKLAVASNLIATENQEASGLIGDFQTTWTILQAIDTKLAQANTTLRSADAALQTKFVSYSSVFTVIDTIVRNEATINSQVDVYNSMVNVLTSKINTDFNGVFTALNATITNVNSSTSFAASMLSPISSKLSVVQTELGTPIYTRDIPLTISTPGRYYLAENINYAATSGTAITINTNNVTIDLNERTLAYTGAVAGVVGILVNNVSNVKIIRGSVLNFAGTSSPTTTGSVVIGSGSTNVIVSHVATAATGHIAANGRNIVINNCRVLNASIVVTASNVKYSNCIQITTVSSPVAAIAFNGTSTNHVIKNCVFYPTDSACGVYGGAGGNVTNMVVEGLNTFGGTYGILNNGTLNGAVIKDSLFAQKTGFGFVLFSGTNVAIKNNSVLNCVVGMGGTPNNTFIGFNTWIQNTGGNVFIAGTNTLLGNFAFNTNAVGNPNNTNYQFSGPTNINGKFITISESTGISGTTAPTYWHNINMLP